MEQIAEAAGVTRITVHRRFANRQALMDALAVSAKQQLIDAVEAARPDTAPALVALYRVTASVLQVKNTWRFSLSHATAHTDAAAMLWDDINNRSLQLLERAQRERLIDPTTDLRWARQVYYALMSEAVQMTGADHEPDRQDLDGLATLVIDTLLRGVGPRE
jgi:AcrR family transcriptional regulator